MRRAWLRRPDLARLRFRRPSRPRLRRERDTRVTITATVLGLLALLLTALALITRELSLDWQPVVVLAALAHTLMFAAPVAVVLLVFARRPVAVVAVLALVLVVITEMPQYVGATGHATGPRLTLMQANLRLGRADAAGLTATVRSRHVDLLTTEEVTGSERARLIAAGLATQLPYDFDATAPGAGGVMIWSRYPLSSEVVQSGFQLGVISATVTIGTQAMTLVAAHMASPYPYPAGGWAGELTRLRAILRSLATGGADVVVGGDFNATVDNAQFRALTTDGFEDGAEQSGAGYLATYPANSWYPPVLGVDHVLVRRADVESVSTVQLSGSDHRGLISLVRLTG